MTEEEDPSIEAVLQEHRADGGIVVSVIRKIEETGVRNQALILNGMRDALSADFTSYTLQFERFHREHLRSIRRAGSRICRCCAGAAQLHISSQAALLFALAPSCPFLECDR